MGYRVSPLRGIAQADEGGGQETFNCEGFDARRVRRVGDEDPGVRGVFGEQLAAGTTGRRTAGQPGDDGDGGEGFLSVGERLEERDAFGAAGESIAGAFDIRAVDDVAISGEQCGSDLEVRVRCHGAFTRLQRLGDQFLPGGDFNARARL